MLFKILVDVILVLVIIVGAIFGFKRGFFLTVTKPVKWFLAFLLAFALAGPVADSVIQPIIEEPVTNQLTEYLEEKCEGITPENADKKLPTLLKLAAGAFDIDVNKIGEDGEGSFISAIVDELALPAVHLVSVILSFFLTYILAKIALSISISLLNHVFEVGVLDTFNKALGLVFGAAFAFVAAWLLVVVFGYVISIPAVAKTEFASSFEGGLIYNFFKKMSPLDLLLSF